MRLQWTFVAEHRDLRRLHWRIGSDIVQALMRFAATGQGAQAVPEERFLRLVHVTGADAIVRIDPSARTVLVLRIYHAR